MSSSPLQRRCPWRMRSSCPESFCLDKGTYMAVQKIYYPGFTIGGMAEPAAMLSLLGLLVLDPSSGPRFWWTLAALASLVAAHAVYWLVTHPVNGFWTRNIQLTGSPQPSSPCFPAASATTGSDCATCGSTRTWRGPCSPC